MARLVGKVVATKVPSAAFIDFAAQAKLARFVSSGASAPYTLPFGFDHGDAMDGNLIGRVVLSTPPFVGPFCRSLSAKSTAQPWHTYPLTPELNNFRI